MKILLVVILILTTAFLTWQIVAFFKHDLPKIKERMAKKKAEKQVNNSSVVDERKDDK